jgi:hypothetical protein
METGIRNCNFELRDEAKEHNYTDKCDKCKHHDLCFKDAGKGRQDFTGWQKKREFKTEQ